MCASTAKGIDDRSSKCVQALLKVLMIDQVYVCKHG
jgi:hypothetical protein